jgi:hypothetical protein
MLGSLVLIIVGFFHAQTGAVHSRHWHWRGFDLPDTRVHN